MAACTSHDLLNRYVFRHFRAFRCRSVPCCRSRYDVLAFAPPGNSPNTPPCSARTTRWPSRVLCTVAYVIPSGGTTRGPAGRPGWPVRGGVASRPNSPRSASAYGAYSSLVTNSGTRPPSRLLTSSTSSSTFSAVRLPTTTLNTRRVSASRATWSHWSPRNRSAAAPSQRFSFLPTKDHFSSSCTLVVWGGKGHEFVVEPAGVRAGQQAVAGGGVLVDAHQPPGLADAAAFLEVLQECQGLLGRQAAVEQRGAFAFGEAGLAGAAAEQAALVAAVAGGNGQVAGPALAVVGAGG